ncbi:MAG: DUF3579 domain-containing protein [Burkholderiaceae bacterium]|jgi:hypothetical protein
MKESESAGSGKAAQEIFIQGVTHDGAIFRPSDWADRLCGVMSCFRPGSANQRFKYSPYVQPVINNGLRCVVVDDRLQNTEPMAFNFLMNFARDNDLVVVAACKLQDDLGQ